VPQTYGADVPQCPRCRKATTGGGNIHSTLTLPIDSTPASEDLCRSFMDFMREAQLQIVKKRKGQSLRPFMGGALIVTVKAPVGPAQTLRYVGASGEHVPTRRWTLSGVRMVTRTAWVDTAADPPLIAGWNYARNAGGGIPALRDGAPYTLTTTTFGNCAAPKMLRAFYEDMRQNHGKPDHNAHWGVQELQMTEMWWHPEETAGRYEVIPSCAGCRQLLPQMLCMRP